MLTAVGLRAYGAGGGGRFKHSLDRLQTHGQKDRVGFYYGSLVHEYLGLGMGHCQVLNHPMHHALRRDVS